VPIPRRFDRRPPERDQTRVNERIRVPEVRLIGEDGNQVGVVSRDDALKYAQQRDLDLVEVAAEARPPVVRVLDYSKYKYEQEQKAKAARRHQKNVNVREIKLRPKIAENDYSTKKGHVERFLRGQDKVKITIMFRGREMTHPERGERLLMRLAEDVGDMATVEQRPTQDGRNMIMMLAPIKPKPEPADPDAAPADADIAASADVSAAAPADAAPAIPTNTDGPPNGAGAESPPEAVASPAGPRKGRSGRASQRAAS
jgi:translation initiation factor IF-3